MSRFRLIVTGKLHHLIKIFSERLECLKDVKTDIIAGAYELKKVEVETLRLFNKKTGDIEEAKPGTIQLKVKLIIIHNTVHLANMSICRWQDPGNKEIAPCWREMEIILAKLTDSSTKLPERLSGETTLELTTGYLQWSPDESVQTWYKHLVKLPKWAEEQEPMKDVKWIEEKLFQAVTSNIIQKTKEVRLEEQKGSGDITKRHLIPETGLSDSKKDSKKDPFIKIGYLNEEKEIKTRELPIRDLHPKNQDVGHKDNIPKGPVIPRYIMKEELSRKVPKPSKVEFEADDGRYQHLYATAGSEDESESEAEQMNMQDIVRNKERVEDFFRHQTGNESIQKINEMSEKMSISNPPDQVQRSHPQQNQTWPMSGSDPTMPGAWSMSGPGNVSSPPERQVHSLNQVQNQNIPEPWSMFNHKPPIPENFSTAERMNVSGLPVMVSMPEQQQVNIPLQHQVRVSDNQRNEAFSMPQQKRDTSFVQSMNMQQAPREQQPFIQTIRPAGFRNENDQQQPRATGHYVRLAMHSNQRPPVHRVWNNSAWEAQRDHVQYVGLYSQRLRNIPQGRQIRGGIQQTPRPPNQTSDDLIMLSTPRPQIWTQRSQPQGPVFQQRVTFFPPGVSRFPTPVMRTEPFMRQPIFQPRGPFFPPGGNIVTTPVIRKQPFVREPQGTNPPGRQILSTPVTTGKPFIRETPGTYPQDILGRQSPGLLEVPDPQLVPQTTNTNSLENAFQTVRSQLERPSPSNDDREPFLGFRELRKRLEKQSPDNAETGKETNKHHYEEIDKDDHSEQTIPKSWPTPAFHFRHASAPPSVDVIPSPAHLPQTPSSNTMARPIITIQEEAPEQEGDWQDSDWQDEDELGAAGGLRRGDSWENGHNVEGLEWDDTTFDWEWNPIKQSDREEQEQLQGLINSELQIVHALEKRINKSSALEKIYDNENIQCSLLYDDKILKVTTDPNVLHDDQKERLKMMREIYEEVKLKKDRTMQALENVTDIGARRKSKRLSSKPRRIYKK